MTNDEAMIECQMINDETNAGDMGPERRYDLEERTAVFGESVARFCKKIPVNDVTSPLIRQLVKAGTSVGLNYGEANDAESRKDFRHKIGICRKESKECKFALRMIVAAAGEMRDEAAPLWQEAKELNLIFGSILRRLDDGDGKKG